ncbi:MAG: hypothetical protein KDA84_09270 [Planctomycetaceae bacterium]|nr:hypothetical protein [Planctomycetaceae bacterium]
MKSSDLQRKQSFTKSALDPNDNSQKYQQLEAIYLGNLELVQGGYVNICYDYNLTYYCEH